MSVKISVVAVDHKNTMVTVVAYDESKTPPSKITKTPIKCSSMTVKGIESSIKKALKAFDEPVWGGMSIYYELECIK